MRFRLPLWRSDNVTVRARRDRTWEIGVLLEDTREWERYVPEGLALIPILYNESVHLVRAHDVHLHPEESF